MKGGDSSMSFPTIDDEPDYEDDDNESNSEAYIIPKEDLVEEFRNSIKTLESMHNANIFEVTTLAYYDKTTEKAVIDEKALEEISVYELYNQLENIDDAVYLAGLVAYNIVESKSGSLMKKETEINKDTLKKFVETLRKKDDKQDGSEV